MEEVPDDELRAYTLYSSLFIERPSKEEFYDAFYGVYDELSDFISGFLNIPKNKLINRNLEKILEKHSLIYIEQHIFFIDI